jgi:signal transduction histidine kinase
MLQSCLVHSGRRDQRDTRAGHLSARLSNAAALALAVLTALMCLGPLSRDVAPAQDKPRRVLVLYPYNTVVPANVVAGEAAKRRLTERSHQPIELYTEFLDFDRFAGDQYEARAARYLFEKYQDRKPEVMLAMGPQSLRFAVQNEKVLGFEGPMIFCCTSRARLSAVGPPANVTGIISEFDLTKTLALAERLQPAARNLVVVAGAAAFDRQWVEIARRQLAPYAQKYNTTYLAGLPHDDLIGRLKLLPRDSIVILLTIFADGTGRASIPTEMAGKVASASSAPVFSPYESHLGRGVVGGHTDSFESIGHEVADLALQILAGGAPSTLPPRATGSNADRVDWRALKRWNIGESLVPPGGEVRFRPLTLWEQYRWQMTAISAAIVLQALVIAWLLTERRRRHTAERESQQRLQEVVHLNRTATAGALSASIAHELNQPLGAILCNTEAAETLLAGKSPDLEQIRDILADIRRDDQRASDVIKHLRGLLRKRDIEFQEFDLNDAIRRTLDVLEAEAIKRGVDLRPLRLPGAVQVRADPVHLQQVILNLATNAMDAMQNCAPGKRVLTMESALVNESEVEVSVLDSGGGIPVDRLSNVFDAFYTTKSHGTGLGLSIARMIVETCGGRIWAENRAGGGAVFRFTLPLAKARVPA